MKRTPFEALLALIAVVVLILGVPSMPVLAMSPTDLPAERPSSHVLDDADVLSRASRSELNARLEEFGSDRVDARR